MARYIFDIETNGLLDTVSKLHCIVLKDIDTGGRFTYRSDKGNLHEGLKRLQEADEIIAHNGINYDIPALKILCGFSTTAKVSDTLLMSQLIYTDLKDKDFSYSKKNSDFPKRLIGSHSLKAWGYRLGELKGNFGETNDWSEISDEMVTYCEQDVEVTHKLLIHLENQNYAEEAIQLEHQFALIIQRQVEFGFKFNEEKAGQLYAVLAAKRVELYDKLHEVFPGWYREMKKPEYYTIRIEEQNHDVLASTKTACIAMAVSQGMARSVATRLVVAGPPAKRHIPFNPSSRHHIARALREKYSWSPVEFTDDGSPKIDEDILLKLPFPETKLLAEHFLVEKRLGMLAEGKQAWMKLVRKGRIHGELLTNGAVTGRCTHKNPNVAQVPAVKKSKEKGVLLGSEGGYGYECRDLFTVDNGWVLVGADASGLELRCLAHYMAHWDKGAYGLVILEGDIHSVNQEAAGLPTRDNAKTFIYGFLYGAGPEKIGSIVGKGREVGLRLINQFLSKIPALKKLRQAVADAAKKGWIKGLDGRKLHIRSSHAALNTLLQSAGAVAMKKALIIADAQLQSEGYKPGIDYAWVANIHDEVQCQARAEIAEHIGKTIVQSITRAGEYFNFKCRLDGEYKIGKSWAETH